jgi:dipeptidyl aminopeptidase/acylaminoacyl peptidase
MSCPQDACEPSDWSPDGRYLVVTVQRRDIWAIPLTAGDPPYPLLAESFTERDARVSPDGKWLAYVSDESGQAEVSVRSVGGGAQRRFVVSSDGGDQPAWRHDGSELFYATRQGQLQSVTVQSDTQRGLVFGAPVRLKIPVLGERHWGTTYDVSTDGRRVYFPHPETEQAPREFGVVMNWSALLRP